MFKQPWLNRQVFGWAMFDFANQAFTLVILTTMFQVYFVSYVATGWETIPVPIDAGEVNPALVADMPADQQPPQLTASEIEQKQSVGRQLWATSNIVSQLIVIIISPLIGALADFSGAKKKLLFITYVGCVAMTAALGLITPGSVAWGMILFIIGYMFFATGENFLGAFLPELATHRDMGKVSAFGFTLGYIGGFVCLIGAAAVGSIGSEVTGYRLISVWAAVFFLVGAFPTFLVLRERKRPEPMPPGQTVWTVGFHRVANTFRSLHNYSHLFRFLWIMTFYLAGMQIVIFFGGTIATKLFDFSRAQLAAYIILSTATAMLGAFTTALYQDRIGTRNTIMIALCLWTAIMFAAVFIRETWRDIAAVQVLFWVVGGLVGFGMGMLGTSTRAMVGLFSPEHKAAEFFGFYGLAHKGAAILCLCMTIVAERIFAEQYNLVVASSGIFFIGGLIMMMSVDERAGRIAALRAGREHHRRLMALRRQSSAEPSTDAST